MIECVTELLLASGSAKRASMPPTILYNEGWMLRLVVDWFDKNRETIHPPSPCFLFSFFQVHGGIPRPS